jgi:hypothetical protein
MKRRKMRKKLRVKAKAMRIWMEWRMANLLLLILPSMVKSKQASINLPAIPRMSWSIDVILYRLYGWQ